MSRKNGAVGVAAIAGLMSLVVMAPSGGAQGMAGAIRINTTPVPLFPQNPAEVAVGDFVFAGGLVLASTSTDQLHGLSDLDVTADRLTAVTDFGGLLEARLVLDNAERLIGLTDARLTRLIGEEGRPLVGKSESDAEGLAILAGGDRLVSFEGRSRILLYPASGGAPRQVPMPAVSFAQNAGMEALAADPDSGADAYVVGSEFSGETWTCRVSQPACTRGPTALKTVFFGLVAMRRLPGGQMAYLLRTLDEQRRNRVILKIVRDMTQAPTLELAPPMNVDNFEGLAVVPRRDGGLRFYLVSDDNAAAHQRTLLFAFDWRPRVN